MSNFHPLELWVAVAIEGFIYIDVNRLLIDCDRDAATTTTHDRGLQNITTILLSVYQAQQKHWPDTVLK